MRKKITKRRPPLARAQRRFKKIVVAATSLPQGLFQVKLALLAKLQENRARGDYAQAELCRVKLHVLEDHRP